MGGKACGCLQLDMRYLILQGTWDSAKVVPTGEFEDMKCDLVRPFHFLVLT